MCVSLPTYLMMLRFGKCIPNNVFKHLLVSIYHLFHIIYVYLSLVQLIIFTLFLHSQHVSAIHGHLQVSTTMLKLLHCTVCHNFISILKIKTGQPQLILVKTSISSAYQHTHTSQQQHNYTGWVMNIQPKTTTSLHPRTT
jgi:hypothetical protein